MKTYCIALAICCMIAGCKSQQKTTGQNEGIALNGSWQLFYLSGNYSFDSLYGEKKPFIAINTALSQVNGSTGCNSFNGKITLTGKAIHFAESMALTRMMCLNSNGENTFLTAIKKINAWSLLGRDTLNLSGEDETIMRLIRK